MSSQYHGGGFGPWRCGSGRRVLTAGVGRAGPAVFGGWGARCFFFFISGGLQRRSGRVWSQHTTVLPFSVRSLEVEMLEREIICLMSVALALVFPVAVKCCPGFPGYFPESRPWVLSLGAVVVPVVGLAGMSMNSGCFGCMVLSVSLWYVSTT